MRFERILRAQPVIAIAIIWVLAGCSTNAGFGTPVSGPQPVSNGYPQPGVNSPEPVGSGFFNPNATPSPYGSPEPSPTPVPNTLSIVGAALRLAYDGSAKDPTKAPRLVELSFALQNTTQNSAKIATVSAHGDTTAFPDFPISLTAPPNQTSAVASLVVKTSDDPLKYKSILFSFLDGQRKMLGSVKLDVPQPDSTFTGLDVKHPKGPLSIDGAEISPINAGQSVHFECTFAVTNPGAAPASIAEFDIRPPKGNTIKIAIPMVVPARSASGFVSIVVPYNGKNLPSGNYVITAQQSGIVLASASAVLL